MGHSNLLIEYLANSDKALLLVEIEDNKNTIKWANKAFCSILGLLPRELTDKEVAQVFNGVVRFDPLRPCEGVVSVTSVFGKQQAIETKTSPLRAPNWIIEVNIHKESNSSSKQKEAEEKLVALADLAPIGIFHSEIGLRLEYVNNQFVSTFGQSAATLLGVGWLDFFKPADKTKIVDALMDVINGDILKTSIIASIDRGGDIRDVIFHCKHVVKENKVNGFVGVLEDITERLSYEKQLRYLVTHDVLTGALNRQALASKLSELWVAYEEEMIDDISLFFVDIDDFKYINDTYGHGAGDRLLIEITRRLSLKTNFCSEIYRYAGDEFVFVVSPPRGQGQNFSPKDLMEGLHECFREKFHIGDGVLISVSGSIGYAMLSNAKTIDELIHLADGEMYETKKDKKSNQAISINSHTLEV